MPGHQEVAHSFRIVVFQHVAHGKEVAQRFGHLLAIHHHHTGVHPVVDVFAVMRAGRLGNLVFMVREHQIGTAAVNIKMVAQLLAVHRRTFNVPARTPFAPRRRPARLALFRHFPQHEVHRVTLHVNDIHARARLKLLKILTGKLPISRIGRYIEHHIAVIRHIGVPFLD